MVSAFVPFLVLPLDGRRFPLVEGLTAGRGPDNGVLLVDASVSTHHAVFHKVGEGWMVKDLNSTNGTWINGIRIQGKAPLAEGDSLRFGVVELRLEGIGTPLPSGMVAAPPPLPAPPLQPSLPPPLPLPRQLPPPPLPRPMAAAPPPLPAPRPRPESKSHVGLWIGLTACVLLLLSGAWFLWDRLLPGGGMQDFLAFREDAGKTPREAFAKALAPGQLPRLMELNQTLWPTVEPEAGWAYFFRTCVVSGGPRTGNRQAVLFYHPWSDTALLTQWKDQKQLINMEMVPGEALRKGGARPYGGTLGWTCLNAYAPPAVGMVTAQTLKAFEKTFAAGTTLDAALPWLAKPQAREACRVASSLQFAQVVKSLATFSASYDQPARIALIRLLAQGDAAIAKAPGTPPESAKALRDLPGKAWSGFQPTALVDTDSRVLVMAHHRESPDLFLGVVFRREGADLVPERMDLLSFNACYGALK